MNKQPLLSICIPTYNREKFLQETLDNIVHQDGFNTDDIEIVISDNASGDNTTHIVQGFIEKYPNIKYVRNDTNIGADRNVLSVLGLWSGKYLWWITDDDIILPWGLAIILDVLRKNTDDIGLFQMNFNSLNKDGTLLKKAFIWESLPTKVYDNVHELYASYNYLHNWLTFYSINIFSSEIQSYSLNTIPVTNFPHSCIMWLISHKKAMFIGESIIGYRTNNNTDNFWDVWYFFHVFVVCHMQYMKFLRKNHSLVSQWQLTIILIKMIIYSGFLWIKSFTKRLWSKNI